MGAQREDTDPNPKRVGTEPGLGKASGASPAAAVAAVAVEEDAPPPVDFDALHAALGDPVDYEELSSGPAIEKGRPPSDSDANVDVAAEEPAGATKGARIGESSGQSNAAYASKRPRTIPPTRAPLEDPNAPAVIVATDTDTVPTAPPQMTVPLAAPPGPPRPPPFAGGPPSSNPRVEAAHAPSGPHGVAQGQPSSGPHVASNPIFTPQPFPAQARSPHMTMRMPDRPAGMRRAKTPTLVMRARGPSGKQKLVAFVAMLVLVTACGIGVIILRKPRLLGLDPSGDSPTPSASAMPGALGSAPAGASSAPSGAVTAPGATASASASASAGTTTLPIASAKKMPKPPAPPHSGVTAPR